MKAILNIESLLNDDLSSDLSIQSTGSGHDVFILFADAIIDYSGRMGIDARIATAAIFRHVTEFKEFMERDFDETPEQLRGEQP
jgi:hypothetical protein